MAAFLDEYLFYILIGLAVLLAIRIFTLPIKFFFRLLWNTFLGFLLLLLFNMLGGLIGLTIGINAVTALIAGVLGIPGVILMLLVKWLYLQ